MKLLPFKCENNFNELTQRYAKVAENFRGRPRVPCLKGLLSAQSTPATALWAMPRCKPAKSRLGRCHAATFNRIQSWSACSIRVREANSTVLAAVFSSAFFCSTVQSALMPNMATETLYISKRHQGISRTSVLSLFESSWHENHTLHELHMLGLLHLSLSAAKRAI